MRPIVLHDCDGPLGDLVGRALELVRDITGQLHEPHEVTQFDVGLALKLSSKERAELKRRMRLPGFVSSINPNLGAQAYMRELRAIAEVVPVTAILNASPTWAMEREEWLGRWFGFERKAIIQTAAKQYVDGDLFIDDSPEIVAAWLDQRARRGGDAALGMLWTMPHNATLGAGMWVSSSRRVSHYDEILDLVRAEARR